MFSIDGYKENSPDVNNPYNIIPGSKITMQGVGKSLTLIPIVNGKPDYNRRVVANPGDPDIDFGSDVEGVLEVPHAMFGNQVDLSGPYSTNPVFSKALRDTAETMNTVAPWAIGKTPYSALYNKDAVASPLGDPSALRGYRPAGLDLSTYNKTSNDITNRLSSSEISDRINRSNPLVDLNKIKADAEKEKTKDDGFRSAFNPYVGLDLATAISSLGALSKYKPETGAQIAGKAVGMLGLTGKIGFEGARNFMLGRAAMNRQMQLEQEQQRQMRRSNNYRTSWFGEGGVVPSYQKGGSISKMATGHFIKGSDNHPTPNSEVERGEYVQTPDGQTMEVLGKKHSEGGELLNLPAGTKIVSDYVKIGSKLARYFKKEFGLNVTSGSKFATVLDLFKKKIGLEELLKEEEDLINRMKDQESVKNDNTRDLNMSLLSEKYQELQPRKQDLEKKFQTFTNLVFDRQESLKKSKDNSEIMKYYQQGGQMMQGMSPGAPQQQSGQIEQIIMMYAQITGQDPNMIMNQFQQSSPDQQREIIEEMLDTIEDSQEQSMRPPQSDEDPEGLMAQQRQMEQQVMQGQAPQMRRGGRVRMYQQGEMVPYEPTYMTPDDIAYGPQSQSPFTQSSTVELTPYDRARAITGYDASNNRLYQGHADKIAEINGKQYRIYGDGANGMMQDATVPESDIFLYNRGLVKTMSEGYGQQAVPTLAPVVDIVAKPTKTSVTTVESYDSEAYKTKLKQLAMAEALKTLPKDARNAVKKEAKKLEKQVDKEVQNATTEATANSDDVSIEYNGNGTFTLTSPDGEKRVVGTDYNLPSDVTTSEGVTIKNNDDGTYTLTAPDGTQMVVDNPTTASASNSNTSGTNTSTSGNSSAAGTGNQEVIVDEDGNVVDEDGNILKDVAGLGILGVGAVAAGTAAYKYGPRVWRGAKNGWNRVMSRFKGKAPAVDATIVTPTRRTPLGLPGGRPTLGLPGGRPTLGLPGGRPTLGLPAPTGKTGNKNTTSTRTRTTKQSSGKTGGKSLMGNSKSTKTGTTKGTKAGTKANVKGAGKVGKLFGALAAAGLIRELYNSSVNNAASNRYD